MSSDVLGRPPTLEERLRRRFEVELARAEADLQSRSLPKIAVARPRARRNHAFGVAGALVAVAVLVVGLGRWYAATGPAATGSMTSIVIGPDGIPSRIGDEPVLRSPEGAPASGSFLLGGTLRRYAPPCAPPAPEATPIPYPDNALFVRCHAGSTFDAALPPAWVFAPRGSAALDLLHEGDRAVVRAHATDPLAGQCTSADRSRCASAIVLEWIVWSPAISTSPGPDGVPASVNGERVYRASDVKQVSAGTGTFLLGGPVFHFVPSCPAPLQPYSAGELRFLGFCASDGIDGVSVSATSVRLPESGIVVALAHTHDPMAADCPADVRSTCESTVVLDGIVWFGSVAGAPTPEPTPAPSSSPVVTPSAGVSRGPDRVPTAFDGEPVYRASETSRIPATETSVLLAGVAWRLLPVPCPTTPASSNALPSGALDWQFLPPAGLCDPGTALQLALDRSTLPLADFGFRPPLGDLVVLRAHRHDTRAGQCVDRLRCDQAFVPDAVVWNGGPWPIFEGASTLPSFIGQEWVQRSNHEPSAGEVYLLGGTVGEADTTGCPRAAATAGACGKLTVDGRLLEWPLTTRPPAGSSIVVRVEARGLTNATCAAPPCPKAVVLVAKAIAWQGP